MIKDIIHVLNEMIKVYQDIYELSLEKKDAIVSDEVQVVSDSVKKEWKLLSIVQELEEKRIELVSEVAKSRGLDDADGLTIQNLYQWCSSEEAQELKDVSGKLHETVKKQKRINAENQALIEMHLEYMNYMVNIFLKEPQVNSIYGNSGIVADDKTDSIIDSQV